MISVAFHLLACIAMVAASIYWMIQAPEGHSMYRHMLPFVACAGVLGIFVVYGYVIEIFVASYSGAIYDVQGLTTAQIVWISFSVLLMLLPLAGLIPQIGKRGVALIVIGFLAAIPSIVHLVTPSISNQQQAEQGGDGDAEEAV
ncbi:hypothetical protein HZ994_09320 [Akkermansiaceae bacterium]|nr:hypothetical protein HZ994_09320 [Akkermansiaceae bacterium]